jgi:hypothetical protein
MRSRSSPLLLALTTLVVATLVWLAPKAAFAGDASSSASSSASFAASFAPLASASASAYASAPALSVAERLARIAPIDRAPLCDPRGAITFAPPPQMQDVEASLDSGLTLEDCLANLRDGDVKRVAPGRAPLPLDASRASSDAAVLATAVMLAASARELLPAPVASTSCARPGIRSTVDRPPRA